MTTDLVIVGAGGHGREVAALVPDLISPVWDYRFVGFVDDDATKLGRCIGDSLVVGDIGWCLLQGNLAVIVAIGSCEARRNIVERLSESRQITYPSVVDPRAQVGKRVMIGVGSQILQSTVLTCDIEIGTHVIVNVGSTVNHDCVIRDFSSIGPGTHLAGNVTVGSSVDIGVGVSMAPESSVGNGSVLGAGTVVVGDIPANVTAVGVPARVIKRHDTE